MTTTADRVRDLVAPLLPDDVELYDVELHGSTLRIVLDRPGGVDMEAITTVTRAVSSALDEADIVPGPYTLEVSSPGLERALRTPEHFAAAVGSDVRVKLRPGVEGDRRAAGRLAAADGTSITVVGADGSERVVRIDDVTKANVHVDWSPPPKPGSAAARSAEGGGPQRPSSTPNEATP